MQMLCNLRGVEDLIQLPPPTMLASVNAALGIFILTFLHSIRDLPPPLSLGILCHLLHIGIEIGTGVLERGKQNASLLVVED